MDISSIVSEQSQAPQSPTDKAHMMVLNTAIDSANLDRVRKVLKEICADNMQAFDAAYAKLIFDEKAYESSTSKRKRPDSNAQHRYEICVQCESEYDVTDNPENACTWHPGETEPDEEGDFWADHDEDCHGTIDSDWTREEYPEGFRWDCCDKLGNEGGCEMGPHEPDLGKRAKVQD